MISSISILNFAHVDALTINFKTGLNILTGETGAGKSVIVDSILFAMGQRSNQNLVKDKSQASSVTICFDDLSATLAKELEEDLGSPGNQLIIRRVLDSQGRSKLFANDIPITANLARKYRMLLLEISSQHDSMEMLDPHQQLLYFDRFAGISYLSLQNIFIKYQSLDKKLKELNQLNSKRDIETAYLESVISDLQELAFQDGEEDDLLEKRATAAASAKIKSVCALSEESINNIISPAIYKLEKELTKIANVNFEEEVASINSAWSILNDTLVNITKKSDTFSDLSLESIDDRLHAIRAISRKYNIPTCEIGSFFATKIEEQRVLQNISQEIATLEAEVNKAYAEYQAEDRQLSLIRQNMKDNFLAQINKTLQSLHLENAEINLEISSAAPSEYGTDRLEFLIKTNIGMPFAPIAKIASGGELSRVFLALKSLLRKEAEILIFDEIDSGFSGRVSQAVGKKLAELAKDSQLLAITHQPQVASFASNHIRISKQNDNGITKVVAETLSESERLNEIARMLAGSTINENTLKAAKSLIEEAA